jgi:hypothetical protein
MEVDVNVLVGRALPTTSATPELGASDSAGVVDIRNSSAVGGPLLEMEGDFASRRICVVGTV